MNFKAYLISKNIDPVAFEKGEPALWKTWSEEFEQLHPNSFTLQKLNLINPIRRQYRLPESEMIAKAPAKPAVAKPTIPKPSIPGANVALAPTPTPPAAPTNETAATPAPTPPPKPAVPRPVFKPKPPADAGPSAQKL